MSVTSVGLLSMFGLFLGFGARTCGSPHREEGQYRSPEGNTCSLGMDVQLRDDVQLSDDVQSRDDVQLREDVRGSFG